MIFIFLIIYNQDRMSSITRVLHTTTWDEFTSHLPDRFIRSPKVVKEAIMTDINDLVQEFWRTSTDGTDEESIFAMRRLFEILQKCLDSFEVCFIYFCFLRLPSTWLKSTDVDKLQIPARGRGRPNRNQI